MEESARTNTWQGRLRSKGAIIFILPRNQRVHCRLRKHENASQRASHESEIRNISANGRCKQTVRRRCVRRAMLESKDVAAVIFHPPSFIVGFNAETHSKLCYDAMERCGSNVHKRMTDSITLRELALKFDKTIGSVCRSIYNPMLAAKSSMRVCS